MQIKIKISRLISLLLAFLLMVGCVRVRFPLAIQRIKYHSTTLDSLQVRGVILEDVKAELGTPVFTKKEIKTLYQLFDQASKKEGIGRRGYLTIAASTTSRNGIGLYQVQNHYLRSSKKNALKKFGWFYILKFDKKVTGYVWHENYETIHSKSYDELNEFFELYGHLFTDKEIVSIKKKYKSPLTGHFARLKF